MVLLPSLRTVERTTNDIRFSNVTVFGRKVRQWLRHSEFRPDGLAFAETHLVENEFVGASRFLRKEGYVSSFQGAKLTQKGGTSGGTFWI